MAGAGSGECGWMREDIVLGAVFACELDVREGDDEEMKEQTVHDRRKARRREYCRRPREQVLPLINKAKYSSA